MEHQVPQRKEGQDIPEVPPAERSPEGEEISPPKHDEGLGKPPRPPGQAMSAGRPHRRCSSSLASACAPGAIQLHNRPGRADQYPTI